MIEDILPRYQEVADGSKDAFTVPYNIIDSKYLNVYLGKNLQDVTTYSVNGKTVTFITPPTANTTVTVVRVIPTDWDVENLGALNQDSFNKIITLLVAKMQTLEEELDRALKTDVTEDKVSISYFLSIYNEALNTLQQAENKLSQVQAAGTQALSDINTAKNTANTSITTNASDKIAVFDQNATSKTNAFNQNAEDQVDTFNANATSKTSEFNQNVTDKTTAFNTNYTEKKALIDEQVGIASTKANEASSSATTATNQANLAKQYAIGEPSEPTEHSAKYWAEQAESKLSGLSSRVTTIEGKIPSSASSSNQLTDKSYVDTQDNVLQSQIDNKQDTISDLANIRTGAVLGASALQPNDNITELRNNAGYITRITSGDVTAALGYTPYNSSNPDRYTSNVGTVTSVNNTQPDTNGNVTISTGPTYTKGNGIDITNGVISVSSPTLTNNANTGTTIALAVGESSSASERGTAVGWGTSTGDGSVAVGSGSQANVSNAVQLGRGTNTEIGTFYVGVNASNYKMLDPFGIIPDARISSNIARTSAIPAAQVNSDWNANSGVAEILNKPTDFTGADGTNAGTHGFVPAPTATDNDKFLKGDGTWSAPSGGANKDLSNLTSTGQNIANWSSNVTNCITEIPQDIKLELNNGTLTLKSGSKVYVPNGAGNFDKIVINNDITADTSEYSGVYVLTIVNGNPNVVTIITNPVSGDTAPTSPTALQGWYDTTNNLIKRYNNGWQTLIHSFPLAICTSNGTQITSIDQVFNGFGYIGSTIFALPGVKGLIPNGRNTDGSLKNVKLILTSVIKAQANGTKNLKFAITSSGIELYYYDYDDINNYVYRTDTGARYYDRVICGDVVTNNGVITSLTPKTAFHALDYNDSSTISGWAMPSSNYIDLTLGASGATYTAPANGYFNINAKTSGTNYLMRFAIQGTDFSNSTRLSTLYGDLFIPVRKGDVVGLAYDGTLTVGFFRFYYAEGENV